MKSPSWWNPQLRLFAWGRCRKRNSYANHGRNHYVHLSLTLALCSTCLQADDVEKAADYRQGLMNVYAHNLTPMGNTVKGKTAFDPAANDESDAGDTIWLDWDKFQKKYEVLKAQSAKLSKVATGGDEAAMKEQSGKTAKTCKGCHDDFKN